MYKIMFKGITKKSNIFRKRPAQN